MRPSGASSATMVMQWAGQTVGHIMQATQRTWPSSRSIKRCRPRNRSGYFIFSSGYSIVAMSVFLRLPVTFPKKFFMK